MKTVCLVIAFVALTMSLHGQDSVQNAGVHLYLGGKYLRNSMILGLSGAVVASSAAWLPPLMTDDSEKDQESLKWVLVGVGGALGVASVVQFFMGTVHISKAGTIIERKNFKLQASGTAIRLSF